MSTHSISTPGARESNAGDDFHVLWAARRSVRMVERGSDLWLVKVEGVPRSEEEALGPDRDLFLAVDLAEYHRGDRFASATRVFLWQLKYSTRHPELEWTAARLTATQKGTSVLRRLADALRGYLRQHPREEVIAKLVIGLVSNRPANQDLLDALRLAKRELGRHGSAPVQTATLLRNLPIAARPILERLRSASGLKSTEFSDFLRVLSLDECGTESRAFQRLRLLQDLGPLVPGGPIEALRGLCDLIRAEAQPERENSPGISKYDVLASLGVHSEEALFPAPTRFVPLPEPIPTSDQRGLAEAVSRCSGGKLLAHGGAGIGKTTTVRTFDAHLPPGSVVVSYDCYGEGDYLKWGGQRHTHARALVQIINELAVQCGTPFLVRPPSSVSELQRFFQRTVEAATAIVTAGGGLLVIAIDAADNAVVAARLHGDQHDCFVPHLWSMDLPNAARLLMTSRTHRRGLLGAPRGTVEYELAGFDRDASAIHLRRHDPVAEENACNVFHARTSGNPRVQFYVLGRAREEKLALEGLLAISARTPDAIFKDLWQAAVEHSPDPPSARRRLAVLLALTRPVGLELLAEAWDASLTETTDFCLALAPGLTFSDAAVALRDEDFETYLRDQVPLDDLRAAHDSLGTRFLTKADQDEYAARAVADHLAAAGRHADLLSLVLDGPGPEVVRDEMVRWNVQRRRTELALEAARESARDADAARILLLAAEAARTNGAVAAVVRHSPDLAAAFGDPETVARVLLDDEHVRWLGPAHLRAAAMYARDEAGHERALGQLRQAESWLRRRNALPEHETYSWQIETADIAAGAEALYWLRGPERAAEWLGRWRPVENVYAALDQVGRSLAGRISEEVFERDVSSLALSHWTEANLLAAWFRTGRHVSRDRVARLTDQLLESIEVGRRRRKIARRWSVDYAEMLASYGFPGEKVLPFVESLKPLNPELVPHEWSALEQFDAPLRSACLRAELTKSEVSLEGLMPARLRGHSDDPGTQHENEDQRRRFREAVGPSVPIYQLRARALVSSVTAQEVVEQVAAQLDTLVKAYGHRFFKSDPRFRLRARALCGALLSAEADAEDLLLRIADVGERAMRGQAPSLWVDMAEMLLLAGAYRSFAFGLIERAAEALASSALPAADRWKALLHCSEVVERHDREFAFDLFRRALSAAEGIDDDSAHLLAMQSRLGRTLARTRTPEAGAVLVERLARLTEAHRDSVSDPDSVPWLHVLGTVALLNPSAGFALATRWDDEARLQIGPGTAEVVAAAVERQSLQAHERFAFLNLTDAGGENLKDIQASLEAARRAGASVRGRLVRAVEYVSEWIRRDVPPPSRRRFATAVISWADTHGLSNFAGIAELRAMVAFTDTLPQAPDRSTPSYTPPRNEDSERELDEILRTAREGVLDELTQRIEGVWRHGRGTGAVRDFLLLLARSVDPSRRINFLDALVSSGIDPWRWHVREISKALLTILQDWSSSPAIREWTPNGVARFLKNYLPGLASREIGGVEELQGLLALQGITSERRLPIVLDAAAAHLRDLRPQNLHILAEVIGESLSVEERVGLLDWSMSRSERQCRISVPIVSSTVPTDFNRVLALYFWSLFGHPDRGIRWRALHTARDLVRLSNRQLIGELVAVLQTESAGPFRSPRLDFFWLSARVSTLVLLLRLADEFPAAVAPYAVEIAGQALSVDLPHAQIRELARQTALSLSSTVPGSIPSAMVDELRRANRPLACRFPRGIDYNSAEDREDEEERFEFDSMDTVPYWFAPLGRVFGVSTGDVCRRAERWIVDVWGRTDKEWWTDPREIEQYDWQQMQNRQGSVPQVENLRLYLEYHAMQCTAGELVDTTPVAVDTWADFPEPWHDWLDGYLNASENYWLADLRSPTPHLAEFWGHMSPLDEWMRKDNPRDFDAGLGLGEPGHDGWIVAAGHTSVRDPERSGSVYVVSALVSPETARSLMHALQSTEATSFRLPLENDPGGR